MILVFGNHPVSAAWRKISDRGDDSFVKSASYAEFEAGDTPLHHLNLSTGERGTLLKMRGPVTPHEDEYVGGEFETDAEGDPQTELSLFWVTKLAKNKGSTSEMWLHCGADYGQLAVGSYAIFPHSIAHSIITMTSWQGIAWQLKAYKNVPNIERFLTSRRPQS